MAALQEGDPRLLLGGVGKVQAIAADQEAKTRDALGQDLFNLSKLQALEAGQTADQLANLEGQRLAGAQEASAAAQMAKIQNQQRAIGAGGDLLKGLGGLIPEYSKTDINTNNTDMSTALKPVGMTTIESLNPASQLSASTMNIPNDMQKKYGWMTMDFSKFGAAR
jgi:hypothetical protein